MDELHTKMRERTKHWNDFSGQIHWRLDADYCTSFKYHKKSVTFKHIILLSGVGKKSSWYAGNT